MALRTSGWQSVNRAELEGERVVVRKEGGREGRREGGRRKEVGREGRRKGGRERQRMSWWQW